MTSDSDVYPGSDDPDRTHRLGPVEPDSLKRRPHRGGLPIPWVTHVDENGVPDFRVHDNDKRRLIHPHRLCQLCGEPMGEQVTFIGYPVSATTGVFGEPPQHRECLDFALEVCPWLTGREPSGRPFGVEVSSGERPPSPEQLIIWTCFAFEVERDPAGLTELVYRAGPAETIEWHRRPQEVTR